MEKVNVISYDVKTKVQEVKEVDMEIVPYVEPVQPVSELEKLKDTTNYLMATLIMPEYPEV